MSGPTPSPAQALILWCLLGRHGGAPQGEILPAVKKADREALAAAGLLAVEKRGRALVLSVTDSGWRWAGENFRSPLPLGLRALQDWLARIEGHLAATGATLADLVGAPPEAPEIEARPRRTPDAKAPKAAAGRRSLAKGAAAASEPGPDAVRARIEAAYLDLTGGARAEAVRLSALRARLPDLDRATVDAALARILKGDRTARLGQFGDPKAVKKADREAAFSPAGEPFHTLWIQS